MTRVLLGVTVAAVVARRCTRRARRRTTTARWGCARNTRPLVGNVAEAPRWMARTHKAYYRRTIKGGHDFILVDADAKTKGPAFDHARIARVALVRDRQDRTARSTCRSTRSSSWTASAPIQFVAESATWRCELAESICRKATPAEAQQGGGRGGRGGGQGRGRSGRTRRPAVRRHAAGARCRPTAEGSGDLELQRHACATPATKTERKRR